MHGLRAEEPREFRSSGREIGDVYHECIMRVSKRLLAEGILEDKNNMDETEVAGTGIGEGAEEPKTSESQAEAEEGISMEHLAEMVDEELLKLSESYRGGLFVSGDREKYRMSRIRRICEDAVRVLAEQLRLGVTVVLHGAVKCHSSKSNSVEAAGSGPLNTPSTARRSTSREKSTGPI